MTARTQAPIYVPVIVALTQIVAWGTTFYPVSVVSPQIAESLNIPVALAAAAPTALLLGTAAMAIPTTRLLTRSGARIVMSSATLVGAAGLGVVAVSSAAWMYFLGWVLTGLAGGGMLTLGAQIAIAEFRPQTARWDLRMMMLATCLPPVIFWPLTNALSAWGWKTAFAVYALALLGCAVLLFIALPAHRALAKAVDRPRSPPPERALLIPLVGMISLAGFVSGGLPLIFIPLFTAAGMAQELAVTIAASLGIIQALARALTLVLRIPALTEVLIASLVMMLGAVLLFVLPLGGAVIAILAVVLFAAGAGIIAVARATLPHELFASDAYAQVSGIISVPLNIVFAVSPALFAALLGISSSLAVGAAVLLIGAAVACILVLRLSLARHTETA